MKHHAAPSRRKSPLQWRGKAIATIAVGAAALGISACGSSSGSSAFASGPVVVATIAPFSGPDAIEGPGTQNDCLAAATVITKAGGVLGRKIICPMADTRSDSADAVPAAEKLLALHPRVSLVLGLGSDEAAAVVPLLNAKKIVMNSFSGQSEWNRSPYRFFFRPSPPDIEEATALVAIAQRTGHHRVALVFGNDLGGQAFVAPAEHAITKAGMHLAINQTLDLSSTTFRTEAQKVIASHPDVIITEAAGAVGNSFLNEYKQQNNGVLPKVELTQNAISSPTYFKDLSSAIGVGTILHGVVADTLYVNPSTPGQPAFRAAIRPIVGNNPGTLQFYETNPNGLDPYDAVIQAALAMDEAKSANPAVYMPFVDKVTNGEPGALRVGTYSAGLAAIKTGKHVHYVGVGIAVHFNKYHNNVGTWQSLKIGPGGTLTPTLTISPAAIAALEG